MHTLQDVLPNKDQRWELITNMTVGVYHGRIPIGIDRYGRKILVLLRIPNHGKFVEIIYNPGGRKPVVEKIRPE